MTRGQGPTLTCGASCELESGPKVLLLSRVEGENDPQTVPQLGSNDDPTNVRPQ